MTTDASNYQWPSCHDYQMGDRGTMALGVATVQEEIPEQVVATEDFETDPITGAGTWTLTGSNPHTGLRCLRSAVIGSNQNTIYTFPVPVPATTIRFWHRVSSEQGFDFFQVYRDAVAGPNLLFQLSGAANIWQQQVIDITGATSIIFRYVKDGSVSVGLDAAFIDDIEWLVPGVAGVELYAPFRLTPDKECVKVFLCNDSVSVSGVVDVRPLDCDTDSITVCPPASGVFDVNVVNSPETRFLECDTDSITVCPPVSGFDVTINPGPCPIPIIAAECIPVNVRLDCEVDSVTICTDDPIDVAARTATLNNGTQVTVGVGATLLSAANPNRRSILIQNVGGVPARIGTTGVTATTGFRLNPGGHLIFNTEDVPVNDIFAIRDGASDTVVLVQEVVM